MSRAQYSAGRDADVRKIHDHLVKGPFFDKDIIDHIASCEAVGQVAQGTAESQSAAELLQHFALLE